MKDEDSNLLEGSKPSNWARMRRRRLLLMAFAISASLWFWLVHYFYWYLLSAGNTHLLWIGCSSGAIVVCAIAVLQGMRWKVLAAVMAGGALGGVIIIHPDAAMAGFKRSVARAIEPEQIEGVARDAVALYGEVGVNAYDAAFPPEILRVFPRRRPVLFVRSSANQLRVSISWRISGRNYMIVIDLGEPPERVGGIASERVNRRIFLVIRAR